MHQEVQYESVYLIDVRCWIVQVVVFLTKYGGADMK